MTYKLFLVCYVNFGYWIYLLSMPKSAMRENDLIYFYPSHIHQRTRLNYKLCLLIGFMIAILCSPCCLVAIILDKILS